MNSVPDDEISVLTANSEAAYILGSFLMCPIVATLSTVLLIRIYFNLNHISLGNTAGSDSRKAALFAIISIICTLICTTTIMLFSSDFYFPMDFSLLNFQLCDVIDALINYSWSCGKICFYVAFNLQVLQYFKHEDNTDSDINCFKKCNLSISISLFLKIWMFAANLSIFLLISVFVFDDALEHHMKEIGKLPRHNIYITMNLSHEGARYAHIACQLIMVVDILYFGVILYFYLRAKRPKQNQNNANDANNPNNRLINTDSFSFHVVKGVVLAAFACVILWVFTSAIAFQLFFDWCLTPLDVVSDDIALFLMFRFNRGIYLRVCGCCHRTVANLLFDGKGYAYDAAMVNDDADADDVDVHSGNGNGSTDESDTSVYTDSALL